MANIKTRLSWISLFLLCNPLLLAIAQAKPAPAKPNIIYLIGDGMGVAYTSAYRYFDNRSSSATVDKTIFDEMLVGSASTYPNDDKLQITDSAAAGTALACGVKTYVTAIAVNKEHQPVKSVLEIAKEQGYRTGMVVTSHINDATPAVFVAHSDSRNSLNEIADQFIDLRIKGRPKVDVIFGGGRQYFVREDRNLEREFAALDYQVVTDLSQLPSINTLPAFGLFAPKGLTSAVDSDHPLRLTEMTQKALSLLQEKPFFLMLEASQIDWCGHANDIVCAMGEMRDMAATMKIIKQFIDTHPNTVFVATADHSTGGLSVGANGEYNWRPSIIKKISATVPVIADRLSENKSRWENEWQQLTSIALTEKEKKEIQSSLDDSTKPMKEKLIVVITQIINQYSATGWTTHGHTGEDVQVFSYGQYKNNFFGAMDNTDIAKKLMAYLKH